MPLLPTPSNVSHLSHIGGLLAGLFVSFLFLPDFKDRRWRRARRATRRLTGRQWPRHPARTTPELPGGHAMLQRSCWGRNPVAYWLVWLLCAGVMLFFFAALPVGLQRYPASGLLVVMRSFIQVQWPCQLTGLVDGM